jgi:hypothetical protein
VFPISERKDELKVRPRTGHEGPEVQYGYECTLSVISALDEGGCSVPRPGRFTPGERPGTHCIGGWVGPRTGMDECRKSRPYQESIPRPSIP